MIDELEFSELEPWEHKYINRLGRVSVKWGTRLADDFCNYVEIAKEAARIGHIPKNCYQPHYRKKMNISIKHKKQLFPVRTMTAEEYHAETSS